MTPDETDLARFQALLLDRLAADLSPEELLDQLRSSPELVSFNDYIDSFEPHLVEVAASLVKQWGRRRNEPED